MLYSLASSANNTKLLTTFKHKSIVIVNTFAVFVEARGLRGNPERRRKDTLSQTLLSLAVWRVIRTAQEWTTVQHFNKQSSRHNY